MKRSKLVTALAVVLFNIAVSNSYAQWSLTGNALTVPTTNYIGTSDVKDLSIRTNAIERIRIGATSGNVGIGTATPGAKLDVFGASNPNFHVGNANTYFEISAPTCSGCYNNFADANSAVLRIINSGLPSKMIFSTASGTNTGVSFLFASEQNVIMTVKDNNTVGINTTCIPTDATLAVNGKIYATAIMVELTNSSGCFPDYVFEKDYKLLSLSEVEKYIKTNKHLPDVPAADEVEEKGMDLAAMNNILLRKVEELTLHMIDMKKEIEVLKKK
jgi:hypothetical protein